MEEVDYTNYIYEPYITAIMLWETELCSQFPSLKSNTVLCPSHCNKTLQTYSHSVLIELSDVVGS